MNIRDEFSAKQNSILDTHIRAHDTFKIMTVAAREFGLDPEALLDETIDRLIDLCDACGVMLEFLSDALSVLDGDEAAMFDHSRKMTEVRRDRAIDFIGQLGNFNGTRKTYAEVLVEQYCGDNADYEFVYDEGI